MEKEQIQIEHLLPDYFSGEIDEGNRLKVEEWKDESDENKKLFREMATIWDSSAILEQMEQFNATDALRKINHLLKPELKLGQRLQKIAAILLLPLLLYSGYLTIQQVNNSDSGNNPAVQKVRTTTGMVSELTLPDGTHVWLNSESSLEYPMNFNKIREIKLVGQAFFEVTKDKDHPFVVNMGKINVEVLGTSFDICSYPDELQTEVVLKTGKVNLFTGDYKNKKEISILSPNQYAGYDNVSRKLIIKDVSVDKYLAWKDGILMFVDEPMDAVTRKLSRWFNVNFVIESPELKDYVYRATFNGETLEQVLELLKISAPIDFTIIPRETLANGNYSRKKVIIRKKEN